MFRYLEISTIRPLGDLTIFYIFETLFGNNKVIFNLYETYIVSSNMGDYEAYKEPKPGF